MLRLEIVGFLSHLALIRRRYGIQFPMLSVATIASHTELGEDEVRAALKGMDEGDHRLLAKWGLQVEGGTLVDVSVGPAVEGAPVKRGRGRPKGSLDKEPRKRKGEVVQMGEAA